MMTTREMYVLPTYDQRMYSLPRDIATVVLAIAPLFINVGYATRLNGRLTSYADFADVALGLLLLLLTVNTLSLIVQSDVRFKAVRLVLTATLALVAVYHMVSGFGLLIG